ncbi:hypothetical protein HNP99_001017 [Flavobacterium sp. 28A]|uniref:hypothetical protein n=1 Tax=Flavobacterium sp. 28A TaxID=2735895 RepID=UPI00156F7637|nr:hypothetical protein [Flavobacterium sp. 28A]NRT14673.1 hypothetical protein [Flavobacterium sp. 28A]
MKKIFAFLLIITATNTFAQSITSDSLDKKIIAHFDEFKPELYRFSGLSFYGESKATFEKEQIIKELQLYNEVKKAILINKPTNSVFALCHNLLIHSPEKGKELLALLNKPTENNETIANLFTELIFTAEYGEQMALDNLKSNNIGWSKIWAGYLSSLAIYESSIPIIEKIFQQTNDTEIQQDLIGALMYISNPKSIEFIKQIIESTKYDEVQTKAIYALAELSGNDGIKYLESIKTIGKKSKVEKKSSLDWLKNDTSPQNKYGTLVTNDIGFIERFGDIKSPVIIWLENEGLLELKNAQNPKSLIKNKKDQLLDIIIESKGFGLEAVKAQLFLSIEYTDIDKLLKMRQICYYSPNNFTKSRMNTIGIFIRYLRKTSNINEFK